MRKEAAFILVMMTPAVALSGALADAVAPGIRGVAWTGACAPDKALPGGRWMSAGGSSSYVVRDGRSTFGVARDAKSELQFTCAPGRASLASVTVTFPRDAGTYGQLLTSLRGLFGEPSSTNLPQGSDADGALAAAAMTWIDGTASLRLVRSITGLSSSTAVVIQHPSQPASRAEMGLD